MTISREQLRALLYGKPLGLFNDEGYAPSIEELRQWHDQKVKVFKETGGWEVGNGQIRDD